MKAEAEAKMTTAFARRCTSYDAMLVMQNFERRYRETQVAAVLRRNKQPLTKRPAVAGCEDLKGHA